MRQMWNIVWRTPKIVINISAERYKISLLLVLSNKNKTRWENKKGCLSRYIAFEMEQWRQFCHLPTQQYISIISLPKWYGTLAFAI